MQHPTFLAFLGNTYLEHVHLALHTFHHLAALVRLALVRDQHADNDADDKDADAAQCHDDCEAELEWPRRTLVHEFTDHVRYVLTGL